MKRLIYQYNWVIAIYCLIAGYFGIKMGQEDALLGLSKIMLELGIHSVIITVFVVITGYIALFIIKKFDINDEIVIIPDVEEEFIEFKQSILLHMAIAIITTICLFLFPVMLEYHAPVMLYYCSLARFLIIMSGLFIFDNIVYIIMLAIDYKNTRG